MPDYPRTGRAGYEQSECLSEPEQRKAAPVLYKSLQMAQELFANGEKNADVILGQMTTLIQKSHWEKSTISASPIRKHWPNLK